MTKEHNYSYSRIMKSTSLIGGAQGINLLIGMVRVKFVAVLIGPVGIGLVGTYRATVELIDVISGLGLQSSAVREISASVASGDNETVARTVLTLRRMCLLTGVGGFLLVAALSRVLSEMVFDKPDFAVEIVLVGTTIFFAKVQGGQMALIQGMRRIGDLAKLNVFGVASGSVLSISLYWWLGIQGIIPAIVSLGFIQLIASWWFARKVEVPISKMSWKESFVEAGGMVKLGLAFMWNGLIVVGVGYATRMLIIKEFDLVSVGIYTAAFNLSGMLVNFVLMAMGADYYPSLTAVNLDHKKMRDLVNQQTEIGLLLALPGLIATLALAPLLIKVFYTSEFWQAVDLLRWFALGCFGRVLSWPLGFIVLAKGDSRLFALIETGVNLLHICLIWILLKWVGLEGVATAMPILYAFYTVLMLVVARCLIGFTWNNGVVKLVLGTAPVLAVMFIAGKYLSTTLSTLLGIVVSMGCALLSLRGLMFRLGPEHKVCCFVNKVPLLKHISPL